MKILTKILYAILALIILICILILLCSANPDVANTLSKVTKGLVPVKETTVDESADTVSIDVSALASTEVTDDVTEEELEDQDISYDDYKDKRDLTDVINTDEVEDYSKTDEDDPYKKLIDDGADDAFDDDYFDQFDDKTDAVITEPIITDITDEEEAQEIIDNTEYGELGEDAEFDKLFYPYYHMLNKKGKRLYKQIYANSNALIAEFKPIEECRPKEWIAAFECVLYDHPELFWMNISYYYEYDYQGNTIKVVLQFYKDIPNVEKARNIFDTDAKEILAGAENLSTDYDKEKYIHDVLVEKITYRHNSMDQSAYSSIPNDFTVCAGYARAFQYLMQQLEIPTYFCVGWGGGPHAWNIIKLEDDYYNVDVTWDDTDTSTYDYFNVTDSKNFKHSRMHESRYLPPCKGTKYGGLENDKVNLSDLGVSSDKIYTDYDEYVDDIMEIIESDYSAGKKDIEFKLVISQDLFTEWYSRLFYRTDRTKVVNSTYDSNERDSGYYIGEGFAVILEYTRLSSGDYLIKHVFSVEE